MKTLQPLSLLGLLSTLLLTSPTLGDGCYFPERAFHKIPEISAQRAVLSWKDGVETLVISSALDSEAQKLGWIIPLPSVPKTIEKETPGGLKTLEFCIQPKITHDLYPGLKAAIYSVFIANLLMGVFLFRRKSCLSVGLLVVLIFVILPALMLSASAHTTAKAANVLVEKSATVGSYQISVLRSSKPDELNAWLSQNGFSSLPPEAEKTVADYISSGWVFATIKLTRTESGANAPHPIKLVFQSEEPVYPLKLTALAGGSPQFELFVIGDKRASCDMLNEVFCDSFTKIEHDAQEEYETKTSFSGQTSHTNIGHPAICSLMWNYCVLTKFTGTISSANMTSDMQFTWKSFRAFQQHFYTTTGARYTAMILFILLTGLWNFVAMIICNEQIKEPRGLRRYLVKVILPAFLLFAAGSMIMNASLPKLSSNEVQTSRGHRVNSYLDDLRLDIEHLLKEHPDILHGTQRVIADSLLKALREYRESYEEEPDSLTGAELQLEDSPGNFTVEKQNGKIVIRIYDHSGRIIRSEHKTPGD